VQVDSKGRGTYGRENRGISPGNTGRGLVGSIMNSGPSRSQVLLVRKEKKTQKKGWKRKNSGNDKTIRALKQSKGGPGRLAINEVWEKMHGGWGKGQANGAIKWSDVGIGNNRRLLEYRGFRETQEGGKGPATWG